MLSGPQAYSPARHPTRGILVGQMAELFRAVTLRMSTRCGRHKCHALRGRRTQPFCSASSAFSLARDGDGPQVDFTETRGCPTSFCRGARRGAEQHPSRLGFYGQKRLKPPCVFTTVGENEITSWRVSSPDGIKLGAPTLRPAPSPAETEQ